MEIFLVKNRGGVGMELGYFHLNSRTRRWRLRVTSRVGSPVPHSKVVGKLVAKAKRACKTTYDFLVEVNKIGGMDLVERLKEQPQLQWNPAWITPTWSGEDWWKDSVARAVHQTHCSEKSQGCVAYRDGAKIVAIKPGKYLMKYFPQLTAEEVKFWADRQVQAMKPVEVKFATSKEDCVRAVNLGPSDSCMAAAFNSGNKHWYMGVEHPAAIYATPDLQIAYLEDDAGKIVARAICHATTKAVARAYGDARLLVPALEKLGYFQRDRALVGCRINRIASGDHYYVMAYVDAGIASGGGNLGFSPDHTGNYWVLDTLSNTRFNTYDGYILKGVTLAGNVKPVVRDLDEDHDDDIFCCDACSEMVSNDERCEVIDRLRLRASSIICESCRDDDYTEAYIRRGVSRYVHNDYIVFCRSDDSYYHQVYADELGILGCAVSGDSFFESDMVQTSAGMCHEDAVYRLDYDDPDGNGYAIREDRRICQLTGVTVHIEHTFLVGAVAIWEGVVNDPRFSICLGEAEVRVTFGDTSFVGVLDASDEQKASFNLCVAEEVLV